MARISNCLVRIRNIITLLLSISITGGGIWLSRRPGTHCERFFDKPVIVLGICILVLSIAGLVETCYKVTWLLWVYLFVMFLLIIVLLCITIFAFVVTSKGAGRAVPGRVYKEYVFGDYSAWLQKRVNNHWTRIRICLADNQICHSLRNEGSVPAKQFYRKHLSAFESGCCKPPESCNFEYVNPTTWKKKNTTSLSNNPDCVMWNNDPSTYCYGCQSCKAGLLEKIKSDWKKEALLNVLLLVFLIIVYFIAFFAFRNKREENSFKG